MKFKALIQASSLTIAIFPIGAEQVTTQLLDQRQEGNKIIRIAEIKTSGV